MPLLLEWKNTKPTRGTPSDESAFLWTRMRGTGPIARSMFIVEVYPSWLVGFGQKLGRELINFLSGVAGRNQLERNTKTETMGLDKRMYHFRLPWHWWRAPTQKSQPLWQDRTHLRDSNSMLCVSTNSKWGQWRELLFRGELRRFFYYWE